MRVAADRSQAVQPSVTFYVVEDPAPAAQLHVACRITEKAWRAGHTVLIQHSDRSELARLGARSAQLARDLTPDIWAATFWRLEGPALDTPSHPIKADGQLVGWWLNRLLVCRDAERRPVALGQTFGFLENRPWANSGARNAKSMVTPISAAEALASPLVLRQRG